MINLDEVLKNIEPISKERMKVKEKELSSLLKIPKGLGKLEELAIQLEGIQKNYKVNNIKISSKFYGEQFLHIDKNLAIPYKKE